MDQEKIIKITLAAQICKSLITYFDVNSSEDINRLTDKTVEITNELFKKI